MDAEVSWLIEVEVKAGKLDAFRELMHEMVESARTEPGTLAYSWFISDNGQSVHVYERYTDSATTLIHLGKFAEHFGERFLSLVTPGRFAMYGTPNDAVRAACDGLAPAYLGPFGGFVR